MDITRLKRMLADYPACQKDYAVSVLIDLIYESNDMLLSCAEQFLMTDDHGIITHSYMSTEEALCAMLVQRGILEQISRGKFRVIAESNPTDHMPPSGGQVHPVVGQLPIAVGIKTKS